SDGTIYEQGLGSPGAWYAVGSGATRLVSDATGNVFVLNTNGRVYEHTLGAGGSWTPVGVGPSPASGLSVDPSGNVRAVCVINRAQYIYEHAGGAGWSWPRVGPTPTPTATAPGCPPPWGRLSCPSRGRGSDRRCEKGPRVLPAVSAYPGEAG